MLRRLLGGVSVLALLLGPTAVPAHAAPILAPTLTISADPAVLDPDHPTATYHLAWAKTDTRGNFSKKVKAYGSGYYAVVFRGGPDTFATGTDGKAYVRTYRVAADGNSAIMPSGWLPPRVVAGHWR